MSDRIEKLTKMQRPATSIYKYKKAAEKFDRLVGRGIIEKRSTKDIGMKNILCNKKYND